MKRILCALGLFLVMLSTPRLAAQTLYAGTGSGGRPGTLYTVDPTTATFTAVGPTMIGASPVGLTGLAFHPTTGVLYGVTSNSIAGGATNPHSLVTIDPATGAATLIGDIGGPVGDITFDSSGTLYGWLTTPPSFLMTIDLATGAETQRGTSGLTSNNGNGLTFAKGTLYLSANGADGPLRTVDPVTGSTAANPILSGAPQVPGSISALAPDPDGVLYGVNNTTAGVTTCNLVVIDPSTGVVTNHGLLPANTDALAFTNAGIRALAPSSFFPVIPCRVLDTRTTASILAGATLTLAMTDGGCGIPAAAAAVSINVTVTGVAAAGHLTLYAANQAVPITTSIEFRAGETRGNNAIVGVATDGSGTIGIVNVSAGQLDVVLDVNGYFQQALP